MPHKGWYRKAWRPSKTAKKQVVKRHSKKK